MVIAVAIDEDTAKIKELSEGITYPVLMDPDHILTELYAVSNVPTVIWVDEQDRIVRPNASEFGVDMFIEFTGVSREEHMQQIRDWVRSGAVPDDGAVVVEDLSSDEVQARLHFRLATHARRMGADDVATRHFDRARELAPLDFTIVRAAMPLTGDDPFGQGFFELYEKYAAAGSPFHGIRRPRPQPEAAE